MERASEFSDYVVYVDESGDHSLTSIDGNYPMFVLSFCVFHKKHYVESVVSRLQRHKFRYFGHDIVLLHERDMRKQTGAFTMLVNEELRDAFLGELTAIIERVNFVLIACAIDKNAYQALHPAPEHPYHLALRFCMERLDRFLAEKNQRHRKTHVVVEARGKKEDKDLELAFRRVCDGGNVEKRHFPFELVFASKQCNSSGLQLADLTARPIGNHVLHPNSVDRAFEVLAHKFYCSGGRAKTGKDFEGWGLKRVP